MSYHEHYDTWQSESAYMASHECSYCGAFRCDGTCTLPDIKEELEMTRETLENVEAYQENIGCPMAEAMERCWPDGVVMGYDYDMLCSVVEDLERTVDKLERLKKNEH